MKIQICPTGLIKRCVWDTYVHYVLGSDKNIEQLIKEDKEVELSERDALVCGLLKVIESDNLIHKFNDYMYHYLTVKSVKCSDDVVIKKKVIDLLVDKFFDKFPTKFWVPETGYAKGLADLQAYVDELKVDLAGLQILNITDQTGTHEFYVSNAVKKCLSFHNY
jgi:hypothetical protein